MGKEIKCRGDIYRIKKQTISKVKSTGLKMLVVKDTEPKHNWMKPPT